MLALLRRRNFLLVWLGGLISLTGDWVLLAGLPLAVYELTGSTLATGLLVMAGSAPRLLLGSVAGVFVDRWDRRRTMIVTDLLLALSLLPLLAVRSADWLWLVYLTSFGLSCLAQFYRPAEGALLPRLVGPRELVTANALNALNLNLARLGGPPLGALLVSRLGLVGIALCDAASFLVAGAMAALVRLDPRPTEPSGRCAADSAPAGAWHKAWQDWLAGLRLVRHERPLAVLFAMLAITGVGEGIFSTLLVAFARTVLRGDPTVYGLLLGAQAVGGLVGGVLVGRFGRLIPAPRLLGVSAVLSGLLDLLIFYYPLFWPGVVMPLMLMALVGIPASGWVVSLLTLLQTQASEAYRGRVLGAAGATAALLGLVGMGLAGVLGDRLGIIPLLTVQGGGYVLAGLLALLLLAPARPANDAQPLSAAVRG